MRQNLRGRTVGLWVVLSISLFILCLYSLISGSVSIPLSDVARVLTGNLNGSTEALIILGIRLPRLIMALLVGSMLSVAGSVAQAVFRNPLADPYVIGISAGAVAGASLAFFLGLPDAMYGIFAFSTALATAFLIFSLSGKKGRADTATLLIVGIAVSSFLSAFTSFTMYLSGEDSYRIMVWTMGYLGSATWIRAGLLAIPLVASLGYFIYLRHDLDALAVGDAEAHSLGVDVGKLKKRLLVVVSLIVAFSVAFTGMIGFVGLIIPHAVRLLVGGNHGRLIPAATFAGGVFLLLSDTLARTILAPTEIPIGVVTAFFGAPFFLFLALKSRKGVSI